MKVKYCFQCGTQLEGTGEVCPSCGTRIEENVGENQKKSREINTKQKYDSKKHTAPAIIITLLLGLFVWLAATLYSFGTVAEEDNLLNFVQNVEWTDIEMETITNGECLYDTLGEVAFSYIRVYAGKMGYDVKESALEELAEEEFFQEYIVKLANRYIDAVKEKKYKNGYLKLEDISDFLEKNERKVDKIFDDGFSSRMSYFLSEYSYYNEDAIEETEKALNLKTYQKKWGTVLNLVSFVLNNYLAYAFMVLSGLLAISLIAVKRSRFSGYVGSASILAGGLLVATRICLLNVVENLEGPLHLGVEVIPVFLNSFLKTNLWSIVILFVVAALGIAIRIAVGNKQKEKVGGE